MTLIREFLRDVDGAWMPTARRSSTTLVSEATWVSWADPWARSRSQCEGGSLRAEIMSRGTGEVFFRSEGTFNSPLVWDTERERCSYGAITVFHAAPDPNGFPERWEVYTPQESSPGYYQLGPATAIRSFNGRTLRFVARALMSRGSTQPFRVGAF